MENPDKVVVHTPDPCGNCGRDLGDAPVEDVEVRQVLDIPEPRMTSTEHRSERRRCQRGAATKAPFPPEARAYVSYRIVIHGRVRVSKIAKPQYLRGLVGEVHEFDGEDVVVCVDKPVGRLTSGHIRCAPELLEPIEGT